jgi:hypothetical protein
VYTLARFTLLIVIATLSFGCSRNYYNVSRDTFEKKVRVLGVAPIFVDADSDIRHPEKEALVNIIRDASRKSEKELGARLRDTGTFFAVRQLDGDADKLLATLMFRRERRDDAAVTYNKYFYKLPELKELMNKDGLDGIMFTVVSGVTRNDTVYAGNFISYLESDYNFLIMTAQIFDGDGNILWEYPNFRRTMPSLPALFSLQYPDFDEAKANLSDKVEVKFKTIPGITRAFARMEESSLLNKTQVSELYANIFSEMAALLQPEMKPFWKGGKEEKKGEQPKPEAVKPEPPKPAAATPETPKPEASKPEAVKPEGPKAEATKPETPKPEALKPEVPEPETPRTEVLKPEAPIQETPIQETPIQEAPIRETPVPAAK